MSCTHANANRPHTGVNKASSTSPNPSDSGSRPGRLRAKLAPNVAITGTVTTDVTKAIQETKAGKVEFRVDKTGVIHAPVGKVSFDSDKLLENASTLIGAVVRAKPAAAKGKYVRGATLCSTMGPGIPLDVATFNLKTA